MISTNPGVAQFSAVQQSSDVNPIPHIKLSGPLGKGSIFNKEAEIILNLITDCYLLLNSGGEILLSTPKANQLLKKIRAVPPKSHEVGQISLPESILRACQSLVVNCEYLSDRSIPPQAALRVYPNIELRISLLKAGLDDQQLVLVILEDKSQTSLAQATVDQWLYGLTNREKEVWALRLRDYSYQDIAKELYLSVNTVKRHMKTILAKQEQWHFENTELLAS